MAHHIHEWPRNIGVSQVSTHATERPLSFDFASSAVACVVLCAYAYTSHMHIYVFIIRCTYDSLA